MIHNIPFAADEDKIALLKRSRAILYTPDKEHFGIVPIEAMYLGTPVIAVNSGGSFTNVYIILLHRSFGNYRPREDRIPRRPKS